MTVSRNSFLALVMPAIMLMSCATVPKQQVWRPWLRIVNNSQEIPIGAGIRTEVTGETVPLLGDERLVALEMQSDLDHLLERRGYILNGENYDFVMKIVYRTERVDKQRSSLYSSSANWAGILFSSSSGSGSRSGLGVAVARAVGLASMNSLQKTKQVISTVSSYTHTVSAELRDTNDLLFWKGESTWDSRELDITSDILPSLQLLISDLPSSELSIPHLPEVRTSHALNYYRLKCEDRWFTCPALPYRIQFESTWKPREVKDIPNMKGHSALAAYIDLIRTAEYALPLGSKRFSDPLRTDLWTKVRLGAKYTLGKHRKPVYVLIDLSGKSSGYIIKKCRTVGEEEWDEFQMRMDEWRLALRECYNYYEE